ncbi:amylo-alpha-1,6-glucosidase [Sesbania bispinosa]|nr:amylo-alpha-1,6-glucosidase [Sesbania bispinosa]
MGRRGKGKRRGQRERDATKSRSGWDTACMRTAPRGEITGTVGGCWLREAVACGMEAVACTNGHGSYVTALRGEMYACCWWMEAVACLNGHGSYAVVPLGKEEGMRNHGWQNKKAQR